MRWHLHLGVHKSATTHLQQTLARTPTRAAFIPLDDLRGATEEIVEERRRWARRDFRKAVRAHMPRKAKLAVLSEENWLGPAHAACQWPPYPELEERLRIVTGLRGRKRAFLAVRNPADFVTSAYSEALKHHPDQVRREATASAWLDGGSPWCDLALCIARFMPLTVWRYEDYRANWRAILTMICEETADFVDLPDPVSTQRLTLPAVEAIERARDAGDADTVRRTARDMPGPRFTLFDAREHAALSDAYAADLDRLEQVLPGALIHWP